MCVLLASTTFTPPRGRDLLDLVLPNVRGTFVRLDTGANLLFAGCGRGEALVELARQFPKSRFFGVEPSPAQLAAAREAVRTGWLQNAWVEPDTGHLPHLKGIFDFVIRHGDDYTAPLASLTPLLRQRGVLFDLTGEKPDSAGYQASGLIILRCVELPDGFCTIARR